MHRFVGGRVCVCSLYMLRRYDTILLQATNNKKVMEISPTLCGQEIAHRYTCILFWRFFSLPHITYRVGTALVNVMTCKKANEAHTALANIPLCLGGNLTTQINANHAELHCTSAVHECPLFFNTAYFSLVRLVPLNKKNIARWLSNKSERERVLF